MRPRALVERALPCVVVLVLVLVAATPAGATTVSLGANSLDVTASDGAIDATIEATHTVDGTYHVRIDDAAPVVAGADCSIDPADPTVATCLRVFTSSHGVHNVITMATITGGDGADRITVRGPASLALTGDGLAVKAGAGDDVVDVSRVTKVRAFVELGDGNDTLELCRGCTAEGGVGWDTIGWSSPMKPHTTRATGFETIRGSTGGDVYDWPAAERYDMGAGDDTVSVRPSLAGQVIDLGAGNDTVMLRHDRTIRFVHGGPGRDEVVVSTTERNGAFVCLDPRTRVCGSVDGVRRSRTRIGADFENATGGVGPDVLAGNRADNVLKGSYGNDVLVGGVGRDLYFGGQGVDVVTYQYPQLQPGRVRVIHDGRRNDGSRGEDLVHRSVEVVAGTRFNDVLVSRLPRVALFGLNGNDRIVGGRWPDYLDGGGGSDVILARGGGADTVTCGPGRDTVFADRRDEIARDCERVRLR